jgi:zinc protease
MKHQVQPPVFPVQGVNIPDVQCSHLRNGIPVWLIDAGSEDVLRLEIVVRAGQITEELPLLSSTTLMMLNEGTENHSAEEFNTLLDFHGAFINLSPEKDLAGLTFYFLNKHIKKVIELAGEMVFRPAFPENELEALMNKRLRWFLVNREKVANIALDKIFESAFGSEHPYGRTITEDHFRAIRTGMVRDFHSKYYNPSSMALIVSGKIAPATIDLLNEHFGSINPRPESNRIPSATLAGLDKMETDIVKPGAVQSAIRIGSGTINKRHPDYTGMKVVNTILGGYFGSRLMQNIREDKGYTYGISSSLTSLDLSGYKLISTEVSPENRKAAIHEILAEISRLQQSDVERDELDVVRNYMSGELVRMFDGPFALAESFRSAWEFGLDYGYYNRLSEKILKIQPDEIKELARTYYNIEELYKVTVGPE